MLKKTVSLLLCVVMLFSCMSVAVVPANAVDETVKMLITIMKKFPHGKYWNHEGSYENDINSVTSTPCSCHYYDECDYFGGCSCNSYEGAIQCMGYAEVISNKITGADISSYTTSYTFDVSKLRVGDIIRASEHSVCVTGVNGDKISFTDCNYGSACRIRWTTVDKSWFTEFEYVEHLSSNKLTNKDVDFHDPYKDADISNGMPYGETDVETWKAPSDKYVSVRKKAEATAELVVKVPKNKSFKVYEKYSDGTYLWGKIEYNGKEGYGVLNNSYHIDGRYQAPSFKSLTYLHNVEKGVKLTWQAVSGATNYYVIVRSKDGGYSGVALETSKTTATVKDLPEGIYQLAVYAENPLAPSWRASSGVATVKVSKIIISLESISIKKSATMETGKSGMLKAEFAPKNATNKEVTWKSSDSAVVTVDSNGTVKAVSPGKAVITCTSKENKKIKATCNITVKPLAVNPVQIKSGTGADSVGLKWDKVKGADGYIIYCYNAETKALKKIGATSKTTYTVKNLKAATEYMYVVRACEKVGSEYIESSYQPISAVTAPSKVTKLKQAGSDTGRLKLQWTKQENADYYVIFKYNASKKKFIKFATTEKNSYIIKGDAASSGKYRVVAVIEVSDGTVTGKSSETLEGVTGLAVPTVKIGASKTAVKVTWEKVPYATRYSVYRLEGSKKVLAGTVGAKETSFTDKNLKTNTEYTYYIRAERVHSKSLTVYSSFASAKVKTKK